MQCLCIIGPLGVLSPLSELFRANLRNYPWGNWRTGEHLPQGWVSPLVVRMRNPARGRAPRSGGPIARPIAPGVTVRAHLPQGWVSNQMPQPIAPGVNERAACVCPWGKRHMVAHLSWRTRPRGVFASCVRRRNPARRGAPRGGYASPGRSTSFFQPTVTE